MHSIQYYLLYLHTKFISRHHYFILTCTYRCFSKHHLTFIVFRCFLYFKDEPAFVNYYLMQQKKNLSDCSHTRARRCCPIQLSLSSRFECRQSSLECSGETQNFDVLQSAEVCWESETSTLSSHSAIFSRCDSLWGILDLLPSLWGTWFQALTQLEKCSCSRRGSLIWAASLCRQGTIGKTLPYVVSVYSC